PYDSTGIVEGDEGVIVTGYSPIPYDSGGGRFTELKVIVPGYSPIPYDRHAKNRLRHYAGALFVGLFFCQIPCFMRRQMLFSFRVSG
ncbi:MAG: hypothetical protein WCR87_08215, partial [Saccharofermentanales bacterium]